MSRDDDDARLRDGVAQLEDGDARQTRLALLFLSPQQLLEDGEQRGRLLGNMSRVERDPDRNSTCLQLVRGFANTLECGRRRVVAAEDERVRVVVVRRRHGGRRVRAHVLEDGGHLY